MEDTLFLGNIDALRDWGHAEDYVEMQWQILQQKEPDDYVIASGKAYSVREFVLKAAANLGLEIEFKGRGVNEVGLVKSISPPKVNELKDVTTILKPGDPVIRIDPWYFRPSEVEKLLGDPTKAFKKLNFKPRKTFDELVFEMTQSDVINSLADKQTAQLRRNV